MTTVLPAFDDIMVALRAFLLTIVPNTVEVVQGLGNRVPTPASEFVVMTPLFTGRLATNESVYTDPFPTPGGTRAIKQSTRLDVQLDFYGVASAEWAAMTETLLRDPAGCDALAPSCQPLYADEARQIPYVSGEDQYMARWSLTASFQWNPTTTLSQDFAATLDVTLINVDEAYPP